MSQVQEIKQSTDIVQLINERVALTRSGTNWRGLCPFHSEKSPSFFVSEQLQRYRCFGCSEAGDCFTFLEKYEGMTFPEALQYLADRAGIKLEKMSFSREDDQRGRVLEILNLAQEYYRYLLTEHRLGEKGRVYLKERGVTAESLKLFQLGYSLDSWDGLIKYLHKKKKYEMVDLVAAGLVVSGRGREYDRFRSRVMFPLTDHRGRVVGFSGRVLDKDAKEAKYINSSETMVYHKSQMLYGYSQLYQPLRKANEAIIVEGEFDVISSAQAHVNNVVAVKGSALTEEHMKLLSRTVQRVILSFDMDAAGVTATKRAVEVARPFNLEVRVVDFSTLGDQSSKKDPDELARLQPQLWRQLVKSHISAYDFFIRAALRSYDPETAEGKRKIIDELAPVFAHITHAVELEHYISKVSKTLQVKEAVVRSDLQKFGKVKTSGVKKKVAAEPVGAGEEELKETRKSRLEDYILFLLFNSPEDDVVAKAEKLKHISFAKPGLKQIIAQLLKYERSFKLAEFSRTLGDDLQQAVFDLSINDHYVEMLPTLDLEKEWAKAVNELIAQDISEEIQILNQELEKGVDEARQLEILQKIVQLRARQKQA